MILVKYYDIKTGKIEMTSFSQDYNPSDQVSISELVRIWVSAKLGHNFFEIISFVPNSPSNFNEI